jgi:hypothetical protein
VFAFPEAFLHPLVWQLQQQTATDLFSEHAACLLKVSAGPAALHVTALCHHIQIQIMHCMAGRGFLLSA